MHPATMQRTSLQNNPAIDSDVESYSQAYTLNLLVQIYSAKCATSIKAPHTNINTANEILPEYDKGGLLKGVKTKLRGASQSTDFVTDIAYNSKGQRERIKYGNGATTKYTYDEKTFRLIRLWTFRNGGTENLQDLNYTYDPVGNITEIIDNAQKIVFYDNQQVNPCQKFEYDALYRLTKATGREHAQNETDTELEEIYPNAHTSIPNDSSALRNYTREWGYDEVGNVMKMIHTANNGTWNRSYDYASTNNRLMSTKVGNSIVNYTYNQHGSMTSMPHLQNMQWDFAERLSHITKGAGTNATEAYYNYDGSGERVRKVVEKNNGNTIETRLYLGGFEIYRRKVGNVLELERETLHIMDDTKRIALVETLTRDNGVTISNTVSVQRYQLSNNIESATLELDDTAQIISYEEYYPYGDTSYQAGRSESEVSQKRYRYTGKEKDEESGLYYMLARYYSGWLGRWTAADPAGMVDGVNLYAYCRGNPVIASDPSGTDTERSWVEVDENGVQTLHYRRGGARGGFDGGNEGESDTSSENPSETNNVILESGSIDKNSFIEKLISDMKDKKMNVEWLEGIKNQVKAIEFRNLEDTATAVATKDDKIIINSKHFSEVNEENYKEIQSIILHELVHIWQNKTGQVSAEKERKWMGTVKNEDGTRNIFNEVEAYTIQLEFMKNMKIEATETGLKAIKEEFRKIEMGSIDLSGHLGGNTFSKIENPKQLEMKNKAKYLLKNYKEMDKGKQENKKHNYAFPRPTQ